MADPIRPTAGNLSYGRLYDRAPLTRDLRTRAGYEGTQTEGGTRITDADPRFITDPRRSQMAGIAQATAPGRDRQRAALQALQQGVAQERAGASAIDRAALSQAQAAQGAAHGAQSRSIDAAMQSRGLGRSGAALQAQSGVVGATGMQGAADAGRIAGAGIERAGVLQGQLGAAAGALREQSFGEDVARRRALEDLARYNMDYRRGVHERDVGRQYGEELSRVGAEQQNYDNLASAYQGWEELQELLRNYSHEDELRRREREMAAVEQGVDTLTSIAGRGMGG